MKQHIQILAKEKAQVQLGKQAQEINKPEVAQFKN